MESNDREYIKKVLHSNAQLRRLYEEHQILEDRLARYGRRNFLTNAEEMEEKLLKQRKLRGVDQMMEIISVHRAGSGVSL